MSLHRLRTAAATLALIAVLAAGAFAAGAQAATEPLRSGTVISKMDVGIFTFIKAVDGEGKEFWVLTSAHRNFLPRLPSNEPASSHPLP